MNSYAKIMLVCGAAFICVVSVHAQGWTDTCAHLKEWRFRSDQPKVQYDSLRYYIEKCASSDDQSFLAFNSLDGAVQFMSDDTNRFDQYRAWLIRVLYLNTTNPAYFCSCLGSIAGTYQFGKYNPLGYLAVLNFVRQNTKCGWDSVSQAEYTKDSAYDANHGYDASHLPSLDSMGLGFLLNHSSVPSTSTGLPSRYLSSFTSSPNPFTKETTLRFNLNGMMYTTVAIYDELGRLVWGDDRGSSLEAGTHTITLDGKNLPHGTLYARISTGFGEVKSVKLIRE